MYYRRDCKNTSTKYNIFKYPSGNRLYRLRYLLSSVLLLCFIIPRATIAQITFERTYGGLNKEEGNSVSQTSDGGYIIAGTSYSDITGRDNIYLVKTDEMGDTLWTKRYGSVNQESCYSIRQTSDGGYIIAGTIGIVGQNFTDMYVVKTNSTGDPLWTTAWGPVDRFYHGRCVQQTSNGNYIVVGFFGTPSTNWSPKFAMLNAQGEVIDQMPYVGFTGGDDQRFYYVEQTNNGGYIAVGYSQVPGNTDILLVKFWGSLFLDWYTTLGSFPFEMGYCVRQTTDGGFIIAGHNGSDVYLIKTDNSGNMTWEKTYGGPNYEGSYSVQQTSDGGYIVTGFTHSFGAGSSDVYLIKTNSSGDTLWTRTFGGSYWDDGKSVQQTSDGGYIIGGFKDDFGPAGAPDFYLIKTDASGLTDVQIEHNPQILESFSLEQNYPNPFNPKTTIKYQIPELSFVTLKVYDVLGREIVNLVNEEKPIGNYEVEFNATSLPSGIYFYRLQAGSFVESKKMILIK